MRKRNTQTDEAESIAERIRILANEHTLTGLARRINVPASNLHRYLNGARVPADVCARLARELSLNTAWLLHGTGKALLGDVSPDTSSMADSLLELVQAMTAVEHMQIGALTGKHHLRVLRELSDAMTRYEGLRKRLNERSVPVLRAVLDKLQDALDKPDADLAAELCRTADQLGRLCDDPELLRELTVLHGRLAVLGNDTRDIPIMTHKLMTLAFHSGGDLGENELETLGEIVYALVLLGRLDEARRIAKSALELASPATQSSQGGHLLSANLALVQILTGELQDGLSTIAALAGQPSGQDNKQIGSVFVQALLYAGALDVPNAVVFGHDSVRKARVLHAYSALIEDEQSLSCAKEYWDEYWDRVHPSRTSKGQYYWYGDQLLSLLRGENISIGPVRKFVQQPPRPDDIPLNWWLILGTRLYRLMGEKDEARRCFRKCCRNIAQLPDWYRLTVTWRALHNRNALELGTKAQQKEARKWFEHHIELGYRCFVHLIEQPSGDSQ